MHNNPSIQRKLNKLHNIPLIKSDAFVTIPNSVNECTNCLQHLFNNSEEKKAGTSYNLLEQFTINEIVY